MNPKQSTAVLKFGGEVINHVEQLDAVLDDVAVLCARGWRIVLCHGGGPQTTALGQRLGIGMKKVAGQRVTDAETLTIACQAIVGEVGTRVVAAAWSRGIRALGVSVGVVHARRRAPVELPGELGGHVDYGLVGDVSRLDLDALEACWARGLTPVLNPIGLGEGADQPALLNINGDTVAAALAAKLGADHLFAVTSVPGVLRDRLDPSSRIPRLDVAGARAAIADGTVSGGMIPKLEAALAALEGSKAVHILAPEPGAILAAVDEPGSRGTVFLAGP